MNQQQEQREQTISRMWRYGAIFFVVFIIILLILAVRDCYNNGRQCLAYSLGRDIVDTIKQPFFWFK